MESTSDFSSATHSRRRASLPAGVVLQERYRIVRPLGKGGMGAVYEAIDLRLDAAVALKETFSKDQRLRKQFEQEARLLAQLHHPALPRVSDYFTEGDRVFLVMQFIAGEDLAEIIAKQPGPIPRTEVTAWADQLLDALIYLHTRDRRIVHRDIKPHNLKLTANGRIALLDFGLAKAESDTSTVGSSASVFGFTRRYSPPEQMQDEGTSPRSDIYALGATLYHLVTGVKPPDAMARTKAVANSQKDPLQMANEINPAVGPEISAILLQAMALNPNDRFADASEFRESLRRLGRDEMRAINNWTEVHTETASPPSINMTVVSKPPVYDPFDSYSILKPAEAEWLIPRPSRRPFVIAAAFGLMLVGCVYAFSNVRDWIDLSSVVPAYSQGAVRTKSDSASMKTSEVSRTKNSLSLGTGTTERRPNKQPRVNTQPTRSPSPANRTKRSRSR
jgi:serine/threonine protein kinase